MYLERFKHLKNFARIRIEESPNITMRLQRNEKPEDWGRDFYELLTADAPGMRLQRYPDPGPLYQKLTGFLNISEENLVVTSGIDEPIRTLITLTCNRGSTITAPSPTYVMYEVYAKIHSIKFNAITFQPGVFLPPQVLLETIDSSSQIMFLPNPSQPVENVYDLDQLRTIATACMDMGMLFVLDEAYHYFGAPSGIPLINEFDNLLVLRTFSKAFGAAGIRLGYAVGSQKAMAPLKAYRLAHEANSLSLHVGEFLLDNFDTFVCDNIMNTCNARDFLRQACVDYGFSAWGKFGNSVLIDLQKPSNRIKVFEMLIERGIHVKSGFEVPLDRHILVTCGSKVMMQSFFNVLVEIWESLEKSKD